MMFLKNYTSNVPVSETIHKIEKVLIRCGVAGIMKEYGLNTKVIAVTFQVASPGGKITIRLPVEEQHALDALWEEYIGDDLLSDGRVKWSSRKRKPKSDFTEQASRTAWKIIQDWVEVQMSMIQLKQADLIQVFLPYVFDGKRTYYQAIKESNYAGLLPDKKQKS